MIKVVKGDITQLPVDAIVNAANSDLRPGAGVCGAIYQAAGMSLDTETQLHYPGGLATGRAIITSGHRLRAKYVIHAVGPIQYGSGQIAEFAKGQLRQTYVSVFELAIKHKIKTIAIPAISTGIYGFPKEEAARIAVKEAQAYESNFKGIALVAFDAETAGLYEKFLGTPAPDITKVAEQADVLADMEARDRGTPENPTAGIGVKQEVEEADVVSITAVEAEADDDLPIVCSKCGGINGHVEPCANSVKTKISEMVEAYDSGAQARFLRERAAKQKAKAGDEPQGSLGL